MQTFAADKVLTLNGTSQFVFNAWPALAWEITYGTAASPIATVGPVFKISKTEAVDKAGAKNNPVDNESNASLAVYSYGIAGSSMQTNAIFAGASGEPTGTDVVALNAIGRVTGNGTGIGTGAYIVGRRDTPTGKMLAAEFRADNNTDVAATYAPNGFGSGGAIWLSARSLTGKTAGYGAALVGILGATFDVGFAASAGSVLNSTFRDDSSSVVSYKMNGTHTTGIDMSGATLTNVFALPVASKPTVTGSRGSGAALASLLTALATLGLITDSSSA